MKKIYLLQVILLAMGLHAQQLPPVSHQFVPDPENLLLIHKGDSFSIRSTTLQVKKGSTLTTVLQGIGLAAMTYQGQKLVSRSYDKNRSSSVTNVRVNWLIPLGAGLTLSANKLTGTGRRPVQTIRYTFYNKQLVPVQTGIQLYNQKYLRKNGGIVLSGRAGEDGYLRIDNDPSNNKTGNFVVDVIPAPQELALAHPCPVSIAPVSLSKILVADIDVSASLRKITPTLSSPLVPTPSSLPAVKKSLPAPVTLQPSTTPSRAAIVQKPVSVIPKYRPVVTAPLQRPGPQPLKPPFFLKMILIRNGSRPDPVDEEGEDPGDDNTVPPMNGLPQSKLVEQTEDFDEDEDEEPVFDDDDSGIDGEGLEPDGGEDGGGGGGGVGAEDGTEEDEDENDDEDQGPSDPCDESASDFDPSACEEATCDETSPDFDATECEMQKCDETSVNYDDAACDESTCDPTSPNYEPTVCQSWGCTPIDMDAFNENMGAGDRTAMTNQVFNDFFNAMFTGLGIPAPQFNLQPPSGYTVDPTTQEFVPIGGSQLSIGLYQNGVLYLSPFAVGSGLDILITSLGHELAHIWLAANDPTDAANDNFNETFAYYYEASIWDALGQTGKANDTRNFADSHWSLTDPQKIAVLDKLQATNSPKAPPAPCQ